MKKKILNIAAILVALATLNALGTVFFARDAEFILRSTGCSYILGLGSIGLFFIGLAYPKKVYLPNGEAYITD